MSPLIEKALDLTISWGAFALTFLILWAAYSFGRWEKMLLRTRPFLEGKIQDNFPKFILKATIVSNLNPNIATKQVNLEKPLDLSVLFATDEENSLLWLRFLPDTREDKIRDVFLLIIYGYKAIKGITDVPVTHISAALYKSGCRKLPDEPQTIFQMVQAIPLAFAPSLEVDEIARPCIGYYTSEKVALSRGGAYSLTVQGENHAIQLAKSFIERA
jgi:hypothetical protein